MNLRKLFPYFSLTLPIHFLLLFCLTSGLYLISNYASAQTKQLTPSYKVVKVALIDHSWLREEYKEYAVAREKLAKEMVVQKKAFDQTLQALDQQTEEQLRLYNLGGSQEREQIVHQAEEKRSVLTNTYQTEQKTTG